MNMRYQTTTRGGKTSRASRDRGKAGKPVRKPPKPRKAAPVRYRRGTGTGVFAAISGVLTAALFVVHNLTMVLVVLSSWGVTALTGYVEYKTELAARHRALDLPEKQSKPSDGAPRTRKRAPSKPAGGGPGGQTKTTTGSKHVCGEACQRSPKPKSTCRCKAPDCKHGSKAPKVKP